MTATLTQASSSLPARSYAAQGRPLRPARPLLAAEAQPARPALEVGAAPPTWIRPSARQRWMTINLAYYTPERIEQIIRFAISGNMGVQWDLFDLMEDTWPMLTQCLGELKDSVVALERVVHPYCARGQKPTPEAQRRADLIETALYDMHPRQDYDELDFDDTLWHLLDARGKGVSVLEIDWELRDLLDGTSLFAPRSTHWVHPRNYCWSLDSDDRLMLDANAVTGNEESYGQPAGPWINPTQNYGMPLARTPFPENKFIIGILKARTGHALNTQLLRTLGFWWAASNFTAEWFLNYAQIFGQPFRLAYYDPNLAADDKATLQAYLRDMGSSAWGMFPQGTQVEIQQAAAGAQDNPHFALFQFADKLCTIIIKRQTLTTDIGDKGSLAAGEVHERGYDRVIQACGNWVAKTLTTQLLRPMCRLNFGNDRECPYLSLSHRHERNRKQTADGLIASLQAGIVLPKNWVYEQLDIPQPAEGDVIIPRQMGTAPPLLSPVVSPPINATMPRQTGRLARAIVPASAKSNRSRPQRHGASAAGGPLRLDPPIIQTRSTRGPLRARHPLVIVESETAPNHPGMGNKGPGSPTV